MKNLILPFLLFFQWSILSATLLAADDLLIRTQASPEAPWVGQKVTLSIDVLTADGWAQVKNFRNPQIEGGYLLRLETQGTRLNESIGGKSYTGQRYEFLFFARQAGQVTIPRIQLEIEVKSWGRPAASGLEKKSTPAVTLAVKAVPGMKAADEGIATTHFSVTQQWEPRAENLKVGDAVTRTITREAADISAMLFSPLTFPDIEGLGRYPGEPAVDDHYEKGELTGKRTEKTTYIVEQPGSFHLPELTFSWWHVEKEELQQVVLPGLSLSISGQAAAEQGAQTPPTAEGRAGFLIPAALFTALLVAALLFSRKVIKGFFQRLLATSRESEAYYFHRIGSAARDNDPTSMLRRTMQWLDRISPDQPLPRLDNFVGRYGDPALQALSGQLLKLSVSDQSADRTKLFYKGLAKARSRWRRERQRRKKIALLLPEIGLAKEKQFKN